MRVFALAVALSAALFAQNRLTSAEQRSGWKLLFDGQSFKGWRDISKMDPPGDAWTIEAGNFKSRVNPKLREDLVTEETYENFELAWEWKVAPGSNSGVKYAIQDLKPVPASILSKYKRMEDALGECYRTPGLKRADAIGGGPVYVVGFEYQMIDDSSGGARDVLSKTGSLYGMLARMRGTTRTIGDYNESRIVKQGARIEHWLNGELVLDGRLDDPAIAKGLAERWGTQAEVYKLLVQRPHASAPISLQNHNSEAWFRSIRIRRLP